ncbi:MAG TPA: prenyltransferase/squalene oxidase repeat-containing protein, partial [Bradyrhizobium sp.]
MTGMPIDLDLSRDLLLRTTEKLLAGRNRAGHWEGELSSSALSTATATFALHLYQKSLISGAAEGGPGELGPVIDRGIDWLIRHQNPDGGWGDTTLSLSNISTTALCWAALASAKMQASAAVARAEQWLTVSAGGLDPGSLSRAIKGRYGKDKTFSVPILTMCALAGRLGEGPAAWKSIPQL